MPIGPIQAQNAYASALQMVRGITGTPGLDRAGAVARLLQRFPPSDRPAGGGFWPADRARMGQIFDQATRAHDAADALAGSGDARGTLAGLNIDPTIEATGPRVRYRVVVRATTPNGVSSESRVIVDSERVLSENEIRQAAIEEARTQDPLVTRGYNVENFAGPNLTYTTWVVGAGKRR